MSGKTLTSGGLYWISLKLGDQTIRIPCVSVSSEINFEGDILLGLDAITTNKIIIDYGENTLSLSGERIPVTFEERRGLGFVRCINQEQKARIRARIKSTIAIPPKSERLIPLKTRNSRDQEIFFQPYAEFENLASEGIVRADKNGQFAVILENKSGKEVTLARGVVVGRCNPVTTVCRNKETYKVVRATQAQTKTKAEIVDELRPFLNCENTFKEQMLNLLAKYREVIALPDEELG